MFCYDANFIGDDMELGRVSMIVELDGKLCAVVLPPERMRMLVDLASSLSDTGRLPVKQLGSDYKFETIEAS